MTLIKIMMKTTMKIMIMIRKSFLKFNNNLSKNHF